MHTHHLTLREFSLTDGPALSAILADPEVMRYSVRGVMSPHATDEFIQWCVESYANSGFGPWAVVDNASGALAGFCGLNPERVDGADEIELGYRLAPQFWGRGLATEAVRATLEYGFTVLELASIIAIVQPENIASVRVIQKAGFSGYVHSQYHRLAVRIYRMTREQWLTR
ncbi:GNAT family N-acetyltransferase [Pseudomonas caspiana]